jgi:hypothetical protein
MTIYNPFPNLSRFLTRIETGQFASDSNLQSTGTYLFNLIGTISGGGNTGDSSLVTGASGALQLQISSIANNSGYLTSSIANSSFVHLTGNESISGEKTFRLIKVANFNNEGLTANIDGISGSYSAFTGAGYSVSLLEGTLNDLSDKVRLDWNQNILSGDWFSNGSGESPNSLVNFSKLLAVSGVLSSLSLTGGNSSFSLNNLTGNVILSGLGSVSITANGQTILVSGSSISQNISGYITTGDADQRYYTLNNPSGYITGISTGDFVFKTETGQFYPSSNPQNYAQSGFVTNLSGYLISQINASSAGVSILNGLTGIINIVGTGGLTVTSSNQQIFVSGSNQPIDLSGYITTGLADLRYYSINNPSGYSTTGYLHPDLATKLELVNSGSFLYILNTGLSGFILDKVALTGQNLYNLIQNLSGFNVNQFYPINNPSGFITGIDTGFLISYSQTGTTASISGIFRNSLNVIETGFVKTYSDDQQTISSSLIIGGDVSLVEDYSISMEGNSYISLVGLESGIQNIFSFDKGGVSYYAYDSGIDYATNHGYNSKKNQLYAANDSPTGVRIDVNNNLLSGNWRTSNTGTEDLNILNHFQFRNYSGYLQSLISANSAGVGSLNGLSGTLNLIGSNGITISSSGQNITVSGSSSISGYITTGDSDLRYYPLNTNPSGYLTTGESQNLFLTTGEADSIYVKQSSTGDFATTGFVDSLYYLKSNPSGFITGISTENFVSKSETGQFYSTSNPQNFASSGFVTGVSGYLASLITVGSPVVTNNYLAKVKTVIPSWPSFTGGFIASYNNGDLQKFQFAEVLNNDAGRWDSVNNEYTCFESGVYSMVVNVNSIHDASRAGTIFLVKNSSAVEEKALFLANDDNGISRTSSQTFITPCLSGDVLYLGLSVYQSSTRYGTYLSIVKI